MKKHISIIILFLITLFIFVSCAVNSETSMYQAIPTDNENILAAYGQQIYNRENCNNCHTQHIKNQSNKLISLDGLGNKYSNEWLFHFIDQPKVIIHNAEMPEYPSLKSRLLNKTFLTQIKEDYKLKPNTQLLWEQLNKEADSISKTLYLDLKDYNNTDMIALIAYLQQIPISNEFEKIIKKEKEDYIKKNNSIKPSEVLKVANKKESINIGKELYKNNCAVCHGINGQGTIGSNLTDKYWLHGGSKSNIAKSITEGGAPGKGMIGWKAILTTEEIGQLTAYVYSLKGTNPKNAKAPEGEEE